jgi:hypothetical protein
MMTTERPRDYWHQIQTHTEAHGTALRFLYHNKHVLTVIAAILSQAPMKRAALPPGLLRHQKVKRYHMMKRYHSNM